MDEMKMKDEFFGGKGIDTPYERELIDPDIHIEWPEKRSEYQVMPDVMNLIERSREFRLSKALMNYQWLYDEIQSLLGVIEERNQQNSRFKEYHNALKDPSKSLQELIIMEDQYSTYMDSCDIELYGLLYRIGESIRVRMTFLDEFFRTQLTEETNLELIEQAELSSIAEWERIENSITAFYLELSDEIDETADTSIQQLEKKRQIYMDLHNTLADISFIHQNRYAMLLETVEQAKLLIEHPQQLLGNNLSYFIQQLTQLSDWKAAKTHLLLLFRKYKEQLYSLKGKYAMVDDMKETFLSEKQYLFQRMLRHSAHPLREWLYEQEESLADTLDVFAGLMTEALQQSKEQYEDSMMDLLKFYRQEAVFYYEQITCIQKKEQIRRFLKIIEDLYKNNHITEEWIEQYLNEQGYAS
jgi:hypothetical protein